MFNFSWASVIIYLSLSAMQLMADWSMPPEVIYPPSSPYNATNAFIATAGNGNSIAVWFDTT